MRLASKTTNDGWIVWAYPYNKEEYENFFSWCLKAFKHSKNEVLIGLDSESLQPLTLKITGKSLSNRTAIFLAWSDHTPAPTKLLQKYKGGISKKKYR